MTKTLSIALVGLALFGSAAAQAKLTVNAHGRYIGVQADSFGDDHDDVLDVRGDGAAVDFFAGPCTKPSLSHTTVRGGGRRRVEVAACN
jgi:hypothetical protein